MFSKRKVILLSARKNAIPYYPMLEAEISKAGIKKQDIAQKLNLTPRAFSRKITGECDFWLKEVIIIQSIFPAVPIEKLFEHSTD